MKYILLLDQQDGELHKVYMLRFILSTFMQPLMYGF